MLYLYCNNLFQFILCIIIRPLLKPRLVETGSGVFSWKNIKFNMLAISGEIFYTVCFVCQSRKKKHNFSNHSRTVHEHFSGNRNL